MEEARFDTLAEVVVRALYAAAVVDAVVDAAEDGVVEEALGLVKTTDLPRHTEANPVEACPVMDIHHSCYFRPILHNSTEETIHPGRGRIAWCWERPRVHRWTL